MTGPRPRALIADDEPLLRAGLSACSPRRGPSWRSWRRRATAARRWRLSRSTRGCLFPGWHMPGLSGVERRARAGGGASRLRHAFDQYAVGPLPKRARLPGEAGWSPRGLPTRGAAQERSAGRHAAQCRSAWSGSPRTSKEVRPAAAIVVSAPRRPSLRMISVDEIDFLRSDENNTMIAWRAREENPRARIRTP